MAAAWQQLVAFIMLLPPVLLAASACAASTRPLPPFSCDQVTLLQHLGGVTVERAVAPSAAAEVGRGRLAPAAHVEAKQMPDPDEIFWGNRTLRFENYVAEMKLRNNGAGDEKSLMTAVFVSIAVLSIEVLVFCVLAHRYPMVYKHNELEGTAPLALPDTYFGWFWTCHNLTLEEIEAASGLDAAMFIEFTRVSTRFLCRIGMPLVFVMAPLHYFFGNQVEPDDVLGKFGIMNLPNNSPVLILHALLTWYVIWVLRSVLFEAQERFVARRFAWILSMPAPRATTVLVEGIPTQYCSDAALQAYFAKLFPDDQIQDAYVVKQTHWLVSAVAAYESADLGVAESNFEWESAGREEERRPMCRDYYGKLVDKIDYYLERRREAAMRMVAERQRILSASTELNPEVYSSSGFVTFSTRRAAAVAQYLKVRADEEIFTMSTPPDPSDVIYEDLQAGVGTFLKETLGYACTVGLYFAFTPIVLAISWLINMGEMMRIFPILKRFFEAVPAAQPLVEGVVASGGLNIFMSFLPSIFMLIFKNFFTLKAGQWVQHKLQVWYFWFQIIFILLFPVVGSSLWDTMVALLHYPTYTFELLARRLPVSTHFYMNFSVMMWYLHGLQLTRYMNIFKYVCLNAFLDDRRAKELSEPEDQDYYGIGGRSARFTIAFLVGLVYCSLEPFIIIFAGINFVVSESLFGYLLVFAETRKPDLGGVFWVTKLRHVLFGMLVYIMLMFGVLFHRADSHLPGLLVAPAFVYWYRTFSRFHTAFDWQALPFEELMKGEESRPVNHNAPQLARYVQRELVEPKLNEADIDHCCPETRT